MSLGFGMDGMEHEILTIARGVRAAFQDVTYVEIGVAQGVTLAGIADALREGSQNGQRWRAVGVELPNGYSFSYNVTEAYAKGKGLDIKFVVPDNGNMTRPEFGQITVYLKDSQSFLTELWQEQIHFALIDGCHGKPCVKADFLAVEAFMVPGGVVMFHDFGKDQIGQEQPHCPSGIDVYGACCDLGLIGNKRKGWKFMRSLSANRLAGGWDMGVFRKEN